LTERNLITSGLSETIDVGGHRLRIEICRLEHETHWSLEVVNEDGTSHVWDDLFETDQLASDEAHKAINEEGASAFLDNGNVIPFPRR
jgi:hypothetical protein